MWLEKRSIAKSELKSSWSKRIGATFLKFLLHHLCTTDTARFHLRLLSELQAIGKNGPVTHELELSLYSIRKSSLKDRALGEQKKKKTTKNKGFAPGSLTQVGMASSGRAQRESDSEELPTSRYCSAWGYFAMMSAAILSFEMLSFSFCNQHGDFTEANTTEGWTLQVVLQWHWRKVVWMTAHCIVHVLLYSGHSLYFWQLVYYYFYITLKS